LFFLKKRKENKKIRELKNKKMAIFYFPQYEHELFFVGSLNV